MRQVEVGLIVPEYPLHAPRQRQYVEDVGRGLALVRGHIGSAWFIDHLEGPVLEGWTALTYLAARHPDLTWGHTVLSQTFRSPALVAKMAATLDFLTGGRFVLGIGAGGSEADHRAYGYPFPPGRERVEQLDEALQIIRALWAEERVTFEGRHHRVRDASCDPRPERPPPIMVGAFRPQMLRLTARRADWWNVSSTGAEGYRRLAAEFERACDEVGRDPSTVRRVWGGGFVCGRTEAEVAELAAERPVALGPECAYVPGEDIVGTPAQVVAQMRQLAELGVDLFLLDWGGFPRLTTLELLVGEVLPALET